MSAHISSLPGYRAVCSVVAVTYVLLGVSTMLQGPHAVLQPFGVPEQVLSAPHFADFFHWLFVHMAVIGVLIGLLGRYVVHAEHQRVFARVLLIAQAHYTYSDFRTSMLGSGLYPGPRSLVPLSIDVLVFLAFAYLSVRSVAARTRAGAAQMM